MGAWCVFMVVWILVADDLGLGLSLARWTGERGERGVLSDFWADGICHKI